MYDGAVFWRNLQHYFHDVFLKVQMSRASSSGVPSAVLSTPCLTVRRNHHHMYLSDVSPDALHVFDSHNNILCFFKTQLVWNNLTRMSECLSLFPFFSYDFVLKRKGWRAAASLQRVKPIYTSIITFVFTLGRPKYDLSFLIHFFFPTSILLAGKSLSLFVITCTGEPQ